MQAEFWLNCWQKNQLGWQLEQPHPLLLQAPADWLDSRPVFVPLCGKSPDMLWLSQSADVVGAELSAIACQDFFTENQLPFDQSGGGEFSLFSSPGVKIWQGDFFALQPQQLSNCQRLYDRAALIALPEAMRKDYVRKLRELLPAADMLLLSLEYPITERAGPPFSVSANEIAALFDFATVTLFTQQDLTGKGFARRAFHTSSLIETCWRIKWQ